MAILQLREEGYLEELRKKWWFDRSECEKFPNQAKVRLKGEWEESWTVLERSLIWSTLFFFKDSSRSALRFGNIAGIFYILMIGLVISVIIAAFEVLYKAKVEARRSKVYLPRHPTIQLLIVAMNTY